MNLAHPSAFISRVSWFNTRSEPNVQLFYFDLDQIIFNFKNKTWIKKRFKFDNRIVDVLKLVSSRSRSLEPNRYEAFSCVFISGMTGPRIGRPRSGRRKRIRI